MAAEIKDFEKELKKRQKEEKRKERINNVLTWVSDNKEIVVCGISGLALFTKLGMKFGTSLVRKHNLKKEEQLKENYCYDRSLGHYWKLKRKLTNEEWVAIDTRKKNGERLADILDSLKVLA